MALLKTAWANLQDGLGNRFSWSHVKAIFYNYAEHKLLSTKLDEMDALIDAKIAKAMMSNVQVNDQSKVPTSALAYSMSQEISQNEQNIATLNSNTVQNHNAVPDDPDSILTTSVRTINGWSSALYNKLPSEMINSWIICITSTTYEGYIGESILQVLISVQRPYIAVRGGNISGVWGDYTVYQLQETSS